MDNLSGIRKELLQVESFRMVLRETVKHVPSPTVFDGNNVMDSEKQVELWKSRSSEMKGFEKAFQLITGITVEDMKNE